MLKKINLFVIIIFLYFGSSSSSESPASVTKTMFCNELLAEMIESLTRL